MNKTMQHWLLATAAAGVIIMGINFFLFGFPPTPYTSLFLGKDTNTSPGLSIPIEGGITRFIDLIFAPLFGVLYVFFKQGLYQERDYCGILFFGAAAYGLMFYFNQDPLAIFFLILVATSLAIYIKPPHSFQLIVSLWVMTGYYTWGASEHGTGIFPWMLYCLLLILPSVIAYVLRTIFRNVDWYETD